MANQTFTDTPAHNAIYNVTINEDDTFTFNMGDWNDTVQLSGHGQAVANLGSGNDYLDANHLHGPVTADGGAGSDVLIGSKSDDHLFGGANNDTLKGGDGNDFLDGSHARDILTGGGGADTFHFQAYTNADGSPQYSKTSGLNVDVVTDFNHCDKPLSFDGWGSALHWDKGSANFLDGANNVVAHFDHLEGVDLTRTALDTAHHHQEWFFA
jgi:Ca2+-binding RTX toxin-like protein